ncbi:MAG: formate--phosphoribosylaminoimidazolecarboxamide ligase [bacterium]
MINLTVKKPKIATLGSHTALQILKGANDEGFSTIAVCTKEQEAIYRSLFPIADEIIVIDSYRDFFDVEKKLIEENAIVIPHGSFVAYLNLEAHQKMQVPYFGNKDILRWEFDRKQQKHWMAEAGVMLPHVFENHDDIDRPIIVKFYGAGGGKGYFFVKNKEEFRREVELRKLDTSQVILQEYIVGCPVYIHYFYSLLDDRLEIMSLDRRYETNVDSLGRIPSSNQKGMELDPSFVVIGNTPLVLRESLLGKVYEMGRAVVDVSKKLCPHKGLYGAFCLETVATPDQDFYVIEMSARIVAGTNLCINGSYYTDLVYDVPMSTGRRIALEINKAIEFGRLDEIV